MASFKYRMQNILNLKEKLEAQQKMEYAKANAILKEKEEVLENMLIKRSDYQARLRNKQEGLLKLNDIYFLKNAILIMSKMINDQLRQVQMAEVRVEEERIKLNLAMKDRKMHEKLKEKAFNIFKTDLLYKEGKEVDELVAYKYNGDNGNDNK